MVETIEIGGQLRALILRHEMDIKGIQFFTPPESPLQLGVLGHKQGTCIRPHVHRDSERVIRQVYEVLHVDHGKVKADFYDDDGNMVESVILDAGDTILLASVGHGFTVLEDSKILEIKQGPYQGPEEDKQHIDI